MLLATITNPDFFWFLACRFRGAGMAWENSWSLLDLDGSYVGGKSLAESQSCCHTGSKRSFTSRSNRGRDHFISKMDFLQGNFFTSKLCWRRGPTERDFISIWPILLFGGRDRISLSNPSSYQWLSDYLSGEDYSPYLSVRFSGWRRFFLSSGNQPVLDFVRLRSDHHNVFLKTDVFMVAVNEEG